MSANFYLNDPIIQNSKAIKVHSAEVNGNLKLSAKAGTTAMTTETGTNLDLNSNIDIGGVLSLSELLPSTPASVSNAGKIVFPAMSVYTQLTSTTTAVNVASGDQQFIVDTFNTGSIPAGTSVSFAVNNPSIVLSKTIVIMNKMGSTSALTGGIDFVSITASGGMTITRHNFSASVAPGLQRLAFKLIQTA